MSVKFPSLEGVNRIYTQHSVGSADFIYKDSPYVVSIDNMEVMREFAAFLAANGFTHNEKAQKEMHALIYERMVR